MQKPGRSCCLTAGYVTLRVWCMDAKDSGLEVFLGEVQSSR